MYSEFIEIVGGYQVKNIISRILFIAGIIVIIIGFIISLMFTQHEIVNEFGQNSTIFTLSFLLIHVVIGIVLIGLSEIVKLLQAIVNHQLVIHPIEHSSNKELNVDKVNYEKPVSASIKTEIINFYAEQLIKIDDIHVTTIEDVYIVKRGNDKDLIELGGFRPTIISQARIDKNSSLKELLE